MRKMIIAMDGYKYWILININISYWMKHLSFYSTLTLYNYLFCQILTQIYEQLKRTIRKNGTKYKIVMKRGERIDGYINIHIEEAREKSSKSNFGLVKI